MTEFEFGNDNFDFDTDGESAPRGVPSFTVSDEDIGLRADVFISAAAGISRSAAASLAEKGAVTVCGKSGAARTVKKNMKTEAGDVFTVCLPEPEPCSAVPEDIPLDIVYEDDDVIVVNKPQGMVVHPAPGHANGTLVSALLWHCRDSLSDINGVRRPGIVHRIDKDTSGLIIAAKNNEAHMFLASQLADHTLSRVYYAIVLGRLAERGSVDAAIARHKTDRKKMAVVSDGGRRAVTHYRTLEELSGFTYAEMQLETGRTHQIRVHMAHIGHPILGDPVYSHPTQFEKRHPDLLRGQCLHAGRITFIHPRTKQPVTLSCPLPENFERALELLRR